MRRVVFFIIIICIVLFLFNILAFKVLNKTWIWKNSQGGLNVLPKVPTDKGSSLEEELINQGFLKRTIIDDQLIDSEWGKQTLKSFPITLEIPKRFYLDESPVYKRIGLYSNTKEEPTKDNVEIKLLLKEYPEFDKTKYSVDEHDYVSTQLKIFFDSNHINGLENVPKLVLSNGKPLYIFKEKDDRLWYFFYVPTNEQYGYMVSMNEVPWIGEERCKRFVKRLCENMVLGEFTDAQIKQYWPLHEVVIQHAPGVIDLSSAKPSIPF